MKPAHLVFALLSTLSFGIVAAQAADHRYSAAPVVLQSETGPVQASLFDVCLNEGRLELKAQWTTVCVREITYQNGSSCVESRQVAPSAEPVLSQVACTREILTNGGITCVQHGTVVTDYTKPVSVAVYSSAAYDARFAGTARERQIATIQYQVPACAR